MNGSRYLFPGVVTLVGVGLLVFVWQPSRHLQTLNAAEQRAQEADSKAKELHSQAVSLQQKLSDAEAAINSTKGLAQEAIEAAKQAEQGKQALQATLGSREGELAELRASLEQTKAKLEETEAALRLASIRLASTPDLSPALSAVRADLDSTAQQKVQIAQERDAAVKAQREASQAASQLKRDTVAAQKTLLDAQSTMRALRQTMNAMVSKKDLDQTQNQLTQATQQLQALQQELTTQKQALAQTQQSLKAAEVQLSAMVPKKELEAALAQVEQATKMGEQLKLDLSQREKSLQETSTALATTKKSLEEEQKSKTQALTILAAQDKELKGTQQALSAKEKAYQDTSLTLATTQKSLQASEQQNAALKTDLTKRDKELNATKTTLAAREKSLQETSDTLSTTKKSLQATEIALSEASAQMSKMAPKSLDLDTALKQAEQLKFDLAAKDKALSTAESDLAAAKNLLAGMVPREQAENASTQLTATTKDLNRIKGELAYLEKSAAVTRAALSASKYYQAADPNWKGDLARAMEKIAALQSELDAAKTELEQVKAPRSAVATSAPPEPKLESVASAKANGADTRGTYGSSASKSPAAEPTKSTKIDPVYFTRTGPSKSDYERVWKQAQTILQDKPKAAFQITGHANAESSEDENMILSGKQAKALADYLKGKGIPSRQVTIVASGASKPLADNRTNEGKQRNQRVEIEVELSAK